MSPSPSPSFRPWYVEHAAFPPWPRESPCLKGDAPLDPAAALASALARGLFPFGADGAPNGRVIVSSAFSGAPLRLTVWQAPFPIAAAATPSPELQLSCTAEPDTSLAARTDASYGIIPSCVKTPGVSVNPSTSAIRNGSTLVVSVALTSSAGVFPPNSAVCEAALRCDLTRNDGSSALLTRSYIPLVAVAPRMPLLDDIVLERDEALVLHGGTAVNVSMKSLWGPWTTVTLSGAAGASAAAALNATAAAVVRASGAAQVSEQARRMAASAASLSLLTSGNATVTLLAAATSLLQGMGPFAATWQARFQNPTVTMLLVSNGTLRTLPLPVLVVASSGTVARVGLPPLGSICKREARRTVCPEIALSICTAGASDEDLLGITGINGGSLAPFVVRVGAVGVGTSLTLPPFLLSAGLGGDGDTVEDVGAASGMADALPLGAKWLPSQALASAPQSVTGSPVGATSATYLSALGQFGAPPFRYVESCSLLGDFIDPTTSDVCMDASNPLRAKCALGSGASCRPCPADRALCPGGDILIPLPGYWVPDVTSASESEVVKCVGASAAARCPGGVSERGLSRCGPEFSPASFGCSTCAGGYYPSDEDPGVCLLCPPQGNTLAELQSVLAVVGWLLVVATPFALIVVVVTKVYHGNMKDGFKRSLRFYLQVWTALQILVQAAVVTDVLPPLTAKLFARLQVLQFQGVAVHPLCKEGGGAGPLAPAITSLAFSLALLPALAAGAYGARRAVRRVARHGLPQVNARGARKLFALAGIQVLKHAESLLQVAATIAFILYGRTMAISYKLLACSEPVKMPVLSYLALPTRDGAALAPAGLPFSLDVALQCAGLPGASLEAPLVSRYECARLLPQLLLPVNVSTLLSQPYVVCDEGPHVGARGLAVAAIVCYGFLLPLGAYLFLLWRRQRLTSCLGRRRFAPSKTALPCIPLPDLPSAGSKPADKDSQRRCHVSNLCRLRLCPRTIPEVLPDNDPLLRFFSAGAFREDRAIFYVVNLLALQVFSALAAFWSPSHTEGGATAALVISLLTLSYLAVHVTLRRPHREGSQRAVALASYTLTALVMGLTYMSSMTVLSRQRLQIALKRTPSDAAEIAAAHAAIDAYAAKARGTGYLVFACAIALGVVILGSFLEPLIRDAKTYARLRAEAGKEALKRAKAVIDVSVALGKTLALTLQENVGSSARSTGLLRGTDASKVDVFSALGDGDATAGAAAAAAATAASAQTRLTAGSPRQPRPTSVILDRHVMPRDGNSILSKVAPAAVELFGGESRERISMGPTLSVRRRPSSVSLPDGLPSAVHSNKASVAAAPPLQLRVIGAAPDVMAMRSNPLAGRKPQAAMPSSGAGGAGVSSTATANSSYSQAKDKESPAIKQGPLPGPRGPRSPLAGPAAKVPAQRPRGGDQNSAAAAGSPSSAGVTAIATAQPLSNHSILAHARPHLIL